MRVATTDHGWVSLAHTESGTIVGYVVLSPAEEWWRELPGVYELSIEASRDWRGLGIGRRLPEFCLMPLMVAMAARLLPVLRLKATRKTRAACQAAT
jgi:hypothetical protein